MKIINQPCEKSCVSTCIAMLTGRDVFQVRREFHYFYLLGKVETADYLAECGIKTEQMFTTDHSEKPGGLYLLSVPSLNIPAATHCVILDWRNPSTGAAIYDPNNGKPGKKYYVCKWPQDLQPNEYNLLGYSYDLRVLP